MRDFPLPEPRVFDPPPEMARIREKEPVSRVRLPTGDSAWLITRYGDVRTVLTDHRFSRAAATAPDAPRMRPLPADRETILAMDPPEHTRLQRLVAGAFGSRRVEALRPLVDEVVTGLVAALRAGGPRADLVADFAYPLAMSVGCAILGVPYADRDRFEESAEALLTLSSRDPERVRRARTELKDYLADLVAARRREPADDLLGALVAARDGDDALTEAELVAFGATLLVAGYHTTASALVNGMLTLLRSPADLAAVTADPSAVPAVVEEMLRYNTAAVTGGNLRVALEDVTLGAVVVRTGEAVLPSTVAANRDPEVFDDPDSFRPDRTGRAHLAFGAGVHHCLGHRIARLELVAAVTALVAALPGLRLAVPEEELVCTGSVIRNLESLPVEWEAGR
jgi:nocardicin N-oxygenase